MSLNDFIAEFLGGSIAGLIVHNLHRVGLKHNHRSDGEVPAIATERAIVAKSKTEANNKKNLANADSMRLHES